MKSNFYDETRIYAKSYAGSLRLIRNFFAYDLRVRPDHNFTTPPYSSA
jgi:hypothetical protein